MLFQVHFLALLAEERGAGDLGAVAEGCREKLIRRHPHVFGEVRAETAEAVIENWGRIKREEERGGAVFGDLPESLPATLYTHKLLGRAAGAGLGEAGAGEALADGRRVCEEFFSPGWSSEDEAFERIGDLLFAAVAAARALGADPELALREAAHRFRADIDPHA